MEERRNYKRADDALKIVYKVVDIADYDQGAITKNISGGGICFSSRQRLSKGDLLDMQISLPKMPKAIKAVGKIVWVSDSGKLQFPYIMGIHFIDIDPLDKGKILNYVKSSASDGESGVQWID